MPSMSHFFTWNIRKTFVIRRRDAYINTVPRTAARPVIIPDAYIALPLVKPPVRYEMVRFRCGLQLRARRVIKSWCPSFINATRRASLCQYRAAPLVRFNVKHHQSSAHPWCKKENEKERKRRESISRVYTSDFISHSYILRGMHIDCALMLYIRQRLLVKHDRLL